MLNWIQYSTRPSSLAAGSSSIVTFLVKAITRSVNVNIKCAASREPASVGSENLLRTQAQGLQNNFFRRYDLCGIWARVKWLLANRIYRMWREWKLRYLGMKKLPFCSHKTDVQLLLLEGGIWNICAVWRTRGFHFADAMARMIAGVRLCKSFQRRIVILCRLQKCRERPRNESHFLHMCS